MKTLLSLPNFIFSLFVVVLLAACSNPRYINAPSVNNAAFLRQQGDFKLSAAGAGDIASMLEEGRNERSYGFDGQAAVAVTNHFMLTAAGMYRTERDKYSSDDLFFENVDRDIKIDYTRTMFELGAGFFTPITESGKVYFNGVLGLGLGKMKSTDNADPYYSARSRIWDANVTKYFLHPSFNIFFNHYVRMSVAPRFSILKLNNINTNYSIEEETLLGYRDARKHTFGLFEPAILLQTGFKNNNWLKLDLGFNFATDPFTSKSDEYSDKPYAKSYNVQSRNFLVSLGLSFYPMEIRR